MTGNLREMERLLKAVGNRRRLAIVVHLNRAKRSNVGRIAEAIRASFKATSKHLGILFAAGVVERDQEGFTGIYHLREPVHSVVRKILDIL